MVDDLEPLDLLLRRFIANTMSATMRAATTAPPTPAPTIASEEIPWSLLLPGEARLELVWTGEGAVVMAELLAGRVEVVMLRRDVEVLVIADDGEGKPVVMTVFFVTVIILEFGIVCVMPESVILVVLGAGAL